MSPSRKTSTGFGISLLLLCSMCPAQMVPILTRAYGTLEKGYETIMSAATPENRAALAMFVIAEVHPFAGGNGRTARLAMNLYLTQASLTRIIIPTVYRDDYISALKAMSSNAYPVPLMRM